MPDPVLSAWSFGPGPVTPAPESGPGGFDPIFAWHFGKPAATPQPPDLAGGFDPILAWFYGPPPAGPEPVLPINLLAAIREYALTLPVVGRLTGGFRTGIARRGGVTPYAVMRVEGTSLEGTTADRDRLRVNLRISVYDPDLDEASELGEELADELLKVSFRWKRGVSGFPQDRGRVPSVEAVRAPGGSLDLACMTLRFEIHTTREKPGG